MVSDKMTRNGNEKASSEKVSSEKVSGKKTSSAKTDSKKEIEIAMKKLWNADLENGFYRNPILCADYSDPDVIRVGEDFYMIASSFTYVPGVPVLHSKDLVNWELVSYCFRELPFEHYRQPVHGSGTWAPSLRYHNGIFYAFVPFPDEGIFVVKTEDPCGEWSKPWCIREAKGWIDPCPLWDDDGKAYMVFAYARSRCGIKHRLSVCEIDSGDCRVIGEPRLVFDGELSNPTLEGPKFYKRGDWYYIFAPAGGVATGWQTVLRSKSVYGPYEYRIVLHQGDTDVNGPHQGGYVELPDGSGWFVHFQDIGVFGRICHLQPVCWHGDWPFIGVEQNGDGIGEPVLEWRKPVQDKGCGYAIASDDEFDGDVLGLQWQWQANPDSSWYACRGGESCLRLFMVKNQAREENLFWYQPNLLTQIPQNTDFYVETKLTLTGVENGDMAGLGMMGQRYVMACVKSQGEGREQGHKQGHKQDHEQGHEKSLVIVLGTVESKEYAGEAREELGTVAPLPLCGPVWIRMHVRGKALASFAYSTDGELYQAIPGEFSIDRAAWTGTKVALAARNEANVTSSGYCDVDYVRFWPEEER